MSRLILGCGYLGCRVAQRWLQQGHTVYALTRSRARAASWLADGIHPLIGDLLSPGSLPPFPDVTQVLYAVGYDRRAGVSIEHAYVEGLRQALQRLPANCQRLVYVSSTGVYGQEDGSWVDEASPCEPQREGGRACLAAERLLENSPWWKRTVVLRMAGIYGPDRVPRQAEIRSGEPLATPSEGYLNLVHVDDAASIVIKAAAEARCPARYLVSDGQPVLRKEYLAEIARLLGAPAPRYIAPATDDPAAQRARGDKRISNRRLMADLPTNLQYPSFREGLRAILAPASGPAAAG